MLICALVLAGVFRINLLPLTENPFRDILIGFVGTILPLSFFGFFVSERAKNIPFVDSLRRTVVKDIKWIFSDTRFFDICLISLLAGIAEELLFRGVIQAKVGIVASSIIFGLLHFITPAYCIIAIVMGFYLGYLYTIFQSILIPMQIHFLYDLGALVYVRYFIRTK